MNSSLLKMIENHLMLTEDREKKAHYPSEATSCIVQLYYKWIQEKVSNPIKIADKLRMDMGNAIHDYLSNTLVKIGLQSLAEVPFKKDIKGLKYPISGRLDNLFVDKDGTICGVEFKTTYGRGIRDIRDNKMPKESALNQVLIYMYNMTIDRYYLIYIGRDDGYRMEFIFQRKDNEIYLNNEKLSLTEDKIYVIFKKLEECLEIKQIPERPYKVAIRDGEIKDKFVLNKEEYVTDWQCRYCQYRDKCWSAIVDQSKNKRFYGNEEVK